MYEGKDGAASLGHRLHTRSLQDPVRLRSCVDAVCRSERHGIFRLRGFHGHAGHKGEMNLFDGEKRSNRWTLRLFWVDTLTFIPIRHRSAA
ncbi:hypothetical protein [Alkalicoccus luteus]|uniref:hypothetical protein n=1 Tax=Alkalicoccus luteus TaxID=1237094 RepID=UPI00403336AA